MAKVSVIVPNYNKGEYIEDCLMSVSRQTFKDFECIVIDDCSTDNSVDVIEKVISQDNRFRLIKNEKNMGVGVNRNIGISLSNSEYIVTLDSDDYISDNFLAECYNTMTSEPDCILVIPKVFNLYNDNEFVEYPTVDHIHVYNDVLYGNGITNCCMFKKSRMISCGMYRDVVAEDWEFNIRYLYKRFYDIRFNYNAIFYYRHLQNSRSNTGMLDMDIDMFNRFVEPYRKEYGMLKKE